MKQYKRNNFAIVLTVKKNNIEEFYFHIFKFNILGIEEVEIKGNVKLKIYVQERDLQKLILELKENYRTRAGPRILKIDCDINWDKKYKEEYKPFSVGKFKIIPPGSEKYYKKKNIIINPGQGFGTGRHESTKIAISLLVHALESSHYKDFLDVGTGSGILAIVAHKMGQKKVVGIDVDKDSLDNAKENAKLNKIKNINFIREDIEEFYCKKFQLICANMVAEQLINYKKNIENLLSKDGTLILSGVFKGCVKKLKKIYTQNFFITKIVKQGEWVGFLLKPKI